MVGNSRDTKVWRVRVGVASMIDAMWVWMDFSPNWRISPYPKHGSAPTM